MENWVLYFKISSQTIIASHFILNNMWNSSTVLYNLIVYYGTVYQLKTRELNTKGRNT